MLRPPGVASQPIMTTETFIRLTLRGCWHLQITLLSPLLFVTFVTDRHRTTHFTWAFYESLVDFTSIILHFCCTLHALECTVQCVIISQEADHLDESFYNWPICMHSISPPWPGAIKLIPNYWKWSIASPPLSVAPPPPPPGSRRAIISSCALSVPLSCAPRSVINRKQIIGNYFRYYQPHPPWRNRSKGCNVTNIFVLWNIFSQCQRDFSSDSLKYISDPQWMSGPDDNTDVTWHQTVCLSRHYVMISVIMTLIVRLRSCHNYFQSCWWWHPGSLNINNGQQRDNCRYLL